MTAQLSTKNLDKNPFCGYCSNPVQTSLCKCFYDYNSKQKKNLVYVECTHEECNYIVSVADQDSDGYCPTHNFKFD